MKVELLQFIKVTTKSGIFLFNTDGTPANLQVLVKEVEFHGTSPRSSVLKPMTPDELQKQKEKEIMDKLAVAQHLKQREPSMPPVSNKPGDPR